MLTTNKTVSKTRRTPHKNVWIDQNVFHVIPDGVFTAEEIEELRDYDSVVNEFQGHHIYANFLPDDIRPPGVKKL